MTIEECKKLKRGDAVYINEGNGWRERLKFLKLVEVISYGKFTFGQIMANDFDFSNGRSEMMAECLGDGNRLLHVSLRKLHKA